MSPFFTSDERCKPCLPPRKYMYIFLDIESDAIIIYGFMEKFYLNIKLAVWKDTLFYLEDIWILIIKINTYIYKYYTLSELSWKCSVHTRNCKVYCEEALMVLLHMRPFSSFFFLLFIKQFRYHWTMNKYTHTIEFRYYM